MALRDENPYIWRLQQQGLNKHDILDQLNGGKNKRYVSRRQLQAMGYDRTFIDRYMRAQAQQGIGGWESTAKPKPPNAPAAPVDPHYGTNDPEKVSAFDTLKAVLTDYGLDSLTPLLQDLITKGNTDAATLQLEMQKTNEWKTRFAGNEELRKKGLAVLSPAEYVNLERSYASVMREMGLPAGFYDQTQDFVKFIGNNVSAPELRDRAGAAMDLVKQVDPSQRRLMSSMYGIGEGDLAAYFLDPQKAMPILQKQLAAVQTGAAAQRAGIETDYANAARFEKIGEAGVSADQAAAGYAQIANELDPLNDLANIWGKGGFSLDEAEQSTFYGNKDAMKKKNRLVSQEKAAFSGGSGFDARVSGRGETAGRF